MSKLSERFSNALSAGRQASRRVQSTEPPTAAKHYILLLALGRNLAQIKDTVADIRRSDKNAVTLIIVTDKTNISLFQIENCITEYLPSRSALLKKFPNKDADTYLASRLDILMHKWKPVKTLPYGGAAECLVETWRAAYL